MQPTKNQLIVFTYGGPVLFTALLIWRVYRHGWTLLTGVFALLAVFFIGVLIIRFVRQEWILPIYRRWMSVMHVVGGIVAAGIMGLIYYAVFTPVRIILWIAKKDHMRRALDPTAQSYWIKRDNKPFEKKFCHRQF
jgi:hypothetical protein